MPVFTDFGNSIEFEEVDEYIDQELTTQLFRAPERFNEERFDERVDVYALGCTFYFIVTGKYLFHNKDKDKAGCIKERRSYKESLRFIINDILRNLIRNMIRFHLKKRFTVEECLKHKFFNMDLMKLEKKILVKKRSFSCAFEDWNEEKYRKIKKIKRL